MISANKHPIEGITIAEAFEQWPQLAPLFLQHRLACFGCDMIGFCTVGDIGVYYTHVDLPVLLGKIQHVVEGRPGS